MADFDEDDLTEQQEQVLEAYRAMSDEDQDAFLRLVQYITNHRGEEKLSVERMEELMKQFKQLN